MKTYKRRLALILFLAFALACDQQKHDRSLSLHWTEKANGVWSCTVGKKDNIDLLHAAGAQPKMEALNQKPTVAFPLDKSLIKATQLHGKLYLRFPLADDEQIYGLGLQFKEVNRRQKVYRLQVDHYGSKDNGRTHAPVPFYVSSRGYGLLINSARYITVYVGTTVRVDSPNQPEVRDRNTDKNWTSRPPSDAIEILIPAQGAEVIVFGGESPLDAVSRYNLYCGGGSLPPKWGLGFTYRTHRLYSDRDVINEVKVFQERQFPLDFIGLEPGWQSASYPCTYEWDPQRFPQPEKFVEELRRMNVRTNLWLNPYVSPRASLYEKLLTFAGSHSVWTGIVPDYSIPDARRAFMDFFDKNQLDIGVSGVKIDECDGYDHWLWPDVATFPSGIEAEQLRQTYGLILQKMFADTYRQKNLRTYGLTRASNAGASALPFVIYNDYYSHEDFITALVNSSFSGILWTPEVRSSATGEEWLRRMQSVCFSPLAMINAWASGTRPWSFPEVYDAVKNVATLRMRLLPYLYSTFADYHFRGTPPIRAMALVENVNQAEMTEQTKLDDT
ncbi:MAG TPA: TIM-barrel domain-containing protein, partial [bacterium]